MSGFGIRLYKNSDYGVARDLFACGFLEHSGPAFRHCLSLTHIRLFIFLVFYIIFTVTGSIYISVSAIALVIFGLRVLLRQMYDSYVQSCLKGDMLDIKKYYLQRDGYCFWVAESNGEVVGTVAAIPSSPAGGERHMELKHLSVARSHRGRGIAKALCRTMIDFAKERGCDAIILETTQAHKNAQGLYEKIGFRLTHAYYAPLSVAKFIDFIIFTYRYDFPACT